LLFLNKRISTNIYGHFELFNFSSKLITLVAGLVMWPRNAFTVEILNLRPFFEKIGIRSVKLFKGHFTSPETSVTRGAVKHLEKILKI